MTWAMKLFFFGLRNDRAGQMRALLAVGHVRLLI